ncbi:hypothetical protein Tco_1534056 [Tanacetum coccineum]
MESSTSSKPNHPYSPVNRINLDMDFEQNIFSQDYNCSQDYSMGYGSGYGSAHGSTPVNNDVEDDSPVEEVSPVKPKKPSRRIARAKKDDPKEPPKDWTVRKRSRCAKLGAIKNKKKKKKNNEANHESGTNDLDVYHKACAEYKMIYKQDFTLEHCYNVLKDHQGWLDVEMPTFYKSLGRKKSKTSETTSGSASGGINLNDEADEDVEETQEVRPMGRDQSKAKKKSASSSRGGSSSFVDLNRELSIREAEVREAAQLKREKLKIQRRTLELAERDKRDEDILFYNSEINSSLPAIQQQKLLEMKLEIKARYNLDY